MSNFSAFIIGLIIGSGLMISTIKYFLAKYMPKIDVKPEESRVVIDGVVYKLIKDEEN